MKNYYNILEVSENASAEVIEKAYKVLVKKYHPDLQGNAKESDKKIKEINEAYNVLSDSFLKEQYDRELQKERSNSQNNYNLQEENYNRIYKEKERLKYQLAHEKYEKDRIKSQIVRNQEQDSYNISNGIGTLIKTLFSLRPNMERIKSINKIDIIAFVLTVIIVISIGTILYCIPFTHDWINRNFIDTPLVNWIKNIF